MQAVTQSEHFHKTAEVLETGTLDHETPFHHYSPLLSNPMFQLEPSADSAHPSEKGSYPSPVTTLGPHSGFPSALYNLPFTVTTAQYSTSCANTAQIQQLITLHSSRNHRYLGLA